MKNEHLQDWVDLVLGLRVILSPWAIAHVRACYGEPLRILAA